jgi:superfamily I DNA/RNA helicase
LKLLDHHQESIARQYDGGHRIITGPSGSGKTLILVHRAAMLKQYNPAIRNILFVCYNITLVNYIRRLLADKHIPLGENGVEVCHFFQLCAKITGETIPYEKADSEYYDMVIQDTLEKLPSCKLHYDAILIDEGQDFSDEMLKIVTALLNPKTDHLSIALDDNQNIYQRRASWKEVGIHARGRVHRVSWIYRNTQEIADFAKRIIEDGQESRRETPQAELFPEIFEVIHGPQPEIMSFNDYKAVAAWVADRIRTLNEDEGYPFAEIAVIYTMRSPEDDTAIHLPRLLEAAMERKGLLHNWVSEDYRAKRSYDVTTDSVTISTIHSLKGFDYACVFLLGMDWLAPSNRWTEEQIRKLAYVAVTRAREQLFIPYSYENEIVKMLLR